MNKTIWKLRQNWLLWEQMQTEYSHDIKWYKFCEQKMQELDEKAETLRYFLERRCEDDR